MVQKKTDDKKNETTEGNDKQPMWHAMTVDECAKELGLEADDIRTTGLSESDATARLEKYGYNRLSQKEKISLLMRIWKLNCSVLVGILVFVALVSLVKAITTNDSEKRTTNLIEFVLITFVVRYVFYDIRCTKVMLIDRMYLISIYMLFLPLPVV